MHLKRSPCNTSKSGHAFILRGREGGEMKRYDTRLFDGMMWTRLHGRKLGRQVRE